MALNDLITYSGWFLTAVGLAIAGFQYYRTKRLTHRNQELVTIFIEDANYASFEHELIDIMATKLNDPMLVRFLVSCHQRGCDLYRVLVDYYLSNEKHFDYDDLRRICQTPLITYKWQEDYWKGRIALRAENKSKEIPSEPFLAENKLGRLKAYEKRENTKLLSGGNAEQIVGPERRERVSQHEWSGEGRVNSRRPVNSTVRLLPLYC